MIQEAFYSRLSASVAVTAIVGGSVFPHTMPQGATKPALTYDFEFDTASQLLDGVSSLREAFVNVDCWATSYALVHRLANAVEADLLGAAHGEMGSLSPPQMIDAVRVERRFDLFEGDTGLYRVSLQFMIAYYP